MACLRCSSGAPLSLSYASPIDKIIFPAPESSYDDQTAPWKKAKELIWLRDPAEGYQFPVVVMEPQASSQAVLSLLKSRQYSQCHRSSEKISASFQDRLCFFEIRQ